MAGYYVTAQYLLFTHPDLLDDERSVRDHLFSVGNGFGWHGGQLVGDDPALCAMSDVDEARRLALTVHEKGARLAIAFYMTIERFRYEEWFEATSRHRRVLDLVANDDLDAIVAMGRERVAANRADIERQTSALLRSGPLWLVSSLNPVFHTPDDVQDDWLEACVAAAADMEEHVERGAVEPGSREALDALRARLSRMMTERRNAPTVG